MIDHQTDKRSIIDHQAGRLSKIDHLTDKRSIIGRK